MTIEKIQSAREVLNAFMDAQAKDERLDLATVAVIAGLRDDGRLTRTNLLRKLDEARKAALKGGEMQDGGGS